MGKNKQLQYMLYGTVCIVLIIILLMCVWWFLHKPYTKEDFIVPAPYLVMAGITADGKVYYADIDTPVSPKWIETNRISVGDIAGSNGQLYSVGPAQTPSGIKYGSYDSSSQMNATSSQDLTQISVDEYGTIIGSKCPVSGTCDKSIYIFSSPTANVQTVSTTTSVSNVSISGSKYFEGNVSSLYYRDSLTSTRPSTSANASGTTNSVKQVSYDGAVCMIQVDGTLWCADSNVGTANANWKRQGTRKFSQISLKDGRLVGVGTDNVVYYSNTYNNPVWTSVPLQEYTITGSPKPGAPLVFRKVIMFYPALDARRKRFAQGVGTSTGTSTGKCNSNEELIGNFCYQDCSSGRKASGTKCPYRRNNTPAIATCAEGTQYINGGCYKNCGVGYVTDGIFCKPAQTEKSSVPSERAGK